MGNGFALTFSAVFAFCAFILAIISFAGSTSNYNPINKIYAAQLDLRNISISGVFPTVSSGSSSEALGLPGFFNIGLWSYCTADSNGTVTSCTEPKGIQTFNLTAMLYDNIENNQVASLVDSLVDVLLPDNVQNAMNTYNNLVKTTFITMIIGICLTFLAFVVNVLRWLIHAQLLTWVGRFLSFLGFLSLIISGATSLGCYLYIRHLLRDSYDDTGVSLSVGSVFQGIIWGSIFSALLGFILWCTVRSRRVAYVSSSALEEKPLI